MRLRVLLVLLVLLLVGLSAGSIGYNLQAQPAGQALGPTIRSQQLKIAKRRAAGTANVVVNEFPLPVGMRAIEITKGPDGNMWFTYGPRNTGGVGRLTTAGDLTLFEMPLAEPSGIVTGPDGNLWVTQTFANSIVRLTPTGTPRYFNVPTDARPRDITNGPDGNLWFTHSTTGNIGRVTTEGVFVEFTLPVRHKQPTSPRAPTGTSGLPRSSIALGASRPTGQ